MEMLEIVQGDPPEYFPVEYKRGKPKVEDWDRIQVYAQALCIEEMREVTVSAGAIWYWEARKREPVVIDETLRATTIAIIESAHVLLASGKTPPPIKDKKRCKGCSLVDLCEHDAFRHDHSADYKNELLTDISSTG